LGVEDSMMEAVSVVEGASVDKSPANLFRRTCLRAMLS